MNLKKELRKVSEQFENTVPNEIVGLINSEIERLAKSNLKENALKVGDKITDFTLSSSIGELVNISDLLEHGPLVICFYRGSWCPYCNLELAAYQEILTEIHSRGGQLVAISPELPDISLSIADKHALKYEILSDVELEVSDQFGLSFELTEPLAALYDKFGIKLNDIKELNKKKLPSPATYVVDENRTIILASLNIDYRERIEPEEVLAVL